MEFAAALGVDKSVVSNYERGVSGVDDAMATRIAEVLRLPEIEARRALGLWVPDDRQNDDGGGIDPDLLERINRATQTAYAAAEEARELRRELGLPEPERQRRDAG